MSRVSPVLAFTLVLCALAPASALKVTDRPAKCPVCLTEFVAYEVVEPNFEGGMDPDFFLRAVGEPAENYGVWMCPQCYFCALPAAYNDPLDEDKRRTLLEKLESIRKSRPENMPERPDSQRKIPAWFKWKAAYVCYLSGCLPRDPKSTQAYMGDVALRGSWVTRVCGNPIQHSAKLERTYTEVMAEFKQRNKEHLKKNEGGAMCSWYRALGDLMARDIEGGGWTAEEQPVTLLMAGAFYRESGDTARARTFLERAREVKQEEIRKVAERECELLGIEQDFQRSAVEHFKLALEGGEVKGTPRDPLCVYLIGELSRRLGNHAEARQWLLRVPEAPGVRPELLQLADQQIALLPK